MSVRYTQVEMHPRESRPRESIGAAASTATETMAAEAVGERQPALLSDSTRHGLIGNSFSVYVVEQLLSPLRELGSATSATGVKRAIEGLRLRNISVGGGGADARRWCSACESAACIFIH
eukprot:COSAG06_NODE_10137_length_1742_cov_0.953743_2_plen_120_part_00